MHLAELFDRIRRVYGESRPEDEQYVVLGTGNPGPEYRNTRHNAGFWCIDLLAKRAGVKLARMHRHALATATQLGGEPVVLAKPRTFVNRSGLAAAMLLKRFNSTPERLVAVVDDIHLQPGTVRIRARGSAGGHKGLRSIAQSVGTDEFTRVRIGVGAPDDPAEQVEHVLGAPTREERKLVDEAVTRAADVVEAILLDGVEPVMNRYNRPSG